jgi:flagellar protein FlbT
MPLKISLKPNEKIIVNGAVLQNGETHGQLVVHNEASLLREKDILTEEESVSPARRVYYALQCAYLFPGKLRTFLDACEELLTAFAEAAPSTRTLVTDIRGDVAAGRLYQALRKARRLVTKEQEIIDVYEKHPA